MGRGDGGVLEVHVQDPRKTEAGKRERSVGCLNALGDPRLRCLHQSLGARTPKAQRLVHSLHRLARVRWEPNDQDWWEAGKLVREIGDAEKWEINKRREFQNDALIALTARRHGATVVTANAGDFTLLSRELGIRVLALE